MPWAAALQGLTARSVHYYLAFVLKDDPLGPLGRRGGQLAVAFEVRGQVVRVAGRAEGAGAEDRPHWCGCSRLRDVWGHHTTPGGDGGATLV